MQHWMVDPFGATNLHEGARLLLDFSCFLNMMLNCFCQKDYDTKFDLANLNHFLQEL